MGAQQNNCVPFGCNAVNLSQTLNLSPSDETWIVTLLPNNQNTWTNANIFQYEIFLPWISRVRMPTVPTYTKKLHIYMMLEYKNVKAYVRMTISRLFSVVMLSNDMQSHWGKFSSVSQSIDVSLFNTLQASQPSTCDEKSVSLAPFDLEINQKWLLLFYYKNTDISFSLLTLMPN